MIYKTKEILRIQYGQCKIQPHSFWLTCRLYLKMLKYFIHSKKSGILSRFTNNPLKTWRSKWPWLNSPVTCCVLWFASYSYVLGFMLWNASKINYSGGGGQGCEAGSASILYLQWSPNKTWIHVIMWLKVWNNVNLHFSLAYLKILFTM